MINLTALQKDAISNAVRRMYTQVALYPRLGFHVPTGREACAFVGYPEERLGQLPTWAVESFAGVGYPFAANVIRTGDTVLDVGSGSGTDLLIAATDIGDGGHLIGLDMTAAMIQKVKNNIGAHTCVTVRMMEGNAERIPLDDQSVDVVTSNGVLNLVPDKRAAFAEIYRVLRPGGWIQIADIAIGLPFSGECLSDPHLWAECIVGATLMNDYLALIAHAGFLNVETLGHLDYFSASANDVTRSIADSFYARSFVLRAVKPPVLPAAAPFEWPTISTSKTTCCSDRTAARSAAAVADSVLDVSGQTYGTIEPMMKGRMRTLESGQVLEVRTDETAARLGVPAWSRSTGHTLVSTIEDDSGLTRFFLRKR